MRSHVRLTVLCVKAGQLLSGLLWSYSWREKTAWFPLCESSSLRRFPVKITGVIRIRICDQRNNLVENHATFLWLRKAPNSQKMTKIKWDILEISKHCGKWWRFCPLPDLKDEEFFNLEFQERETNPDLHLKSNKSKNNLIFGKTRLKTLQSSISRRF